MPHAHSTRPARPLALEVRGLGKSYGIRSGSSEGPWALRGVDFELERGASLGVVGDNGAGKSTLLRILGGGSAPSEGRYRTSGRAGLLALDGPFHREFTGRENARLAGLGAGLGRRELPEFLDKVREFSGLGAAFEEPLKTYSSGMVMRLGFAAAFETAPRLLLIDEVIAVGDQGFQRRCVERLAGFREGGGTLLLCSHSLYDVRQLCERALWLEGGRPRAIGDAVEVTREYSSNAEGDPGVTSAHEEGGPYLISVEVLDRKGRSVERIETGDPLAVRVAWSRGRGAEPSRGLALGVVFERNDRTLCAAAATHHDGVPLTLDPNAESGAIELAIDRVPLLSGGFTVRAILFDGEGVHRYHERISERGLEVRTSTREVGLVRLGHRWKRPESVPCAEGSAVA